MCPRAASPELPIDGAWVGTLGLDGAIERISAKRYPADARWYVRVLVEGPVEPGDRIVLGSSGVART